MRSCTRHLMQANETAGLFSRRLSPRARFPSNSAIVTHSVSPPRRTNQFWSILRFFNSRSISSNVVQSEVGASLALFLKK